MYIAIDGDSMGKKIEYYILENKLDDLRKFSEKILNNICNMKSLIENEGGKVYMAGGDNILAYIPDKIVISVIKKIRTLVYDQFFSIGYANNVQGAYLALNYAKTKGKNKVIYAINQKEWIFKEINLLA